MSSLCNLLVVMLIAHTAAERGAMFFAEQRAGKVEYIGWPPVKCNDDSQCSGIKGSYCKNDKTKTAPYFCQEPIELVAKGLARPVGVAVDSDAGKIFFTEDDQTGGDTKWPLTSSNFDGSDKTTVIPGLLDPQGIHVDTKAKKVYYTEHHGQRVGVVDYDGKNQKTLHTFTGDITFPSDVVVDNQNGLLFVQVGGALSTGYQLVKMGLDGSSPTVIMKDIVRAYGVTVDPSSKVVYYVSGGHGGFIGNVTYDGSSHGIVLPGLNYPFEVDIDTDLNRLVYTSTGVGDGKVTTCKFDASDCQDVEELGFAPSGISFVDPISNRCFDGCC